MLRLLISRSHALEAPGADRWWRGRLTLRFQMSFVIPREAVKLREGKAFRYWTDPKILARFRERGYKGLCDAVSRGVG